MIRNNLASFVFFLLLSSLCFAAKTQQVKRVYIFNICQYIEWPQKRLSQPQAPIVIAVAGSSLDYKYLGRLASGRKLNGHPFKVIHITDFNNLARAHVLYLPNKSYYSLSDFIENAKKYSVLVITDIPDETEGERGIINFIQQNQQIRFDIDLTMAQEFRLNISSELLSVSRKVLSR